MKDQLIPFNSELHEQLFAMFIGVSNSRIYDILSFNTELEMNRLINTVANEYLLLWEDRSIANVEHEG